MGIYYCCLALHSCSNVATCRTNQINTTKIREVVSVANASVGHCAYKAEFFQVDLSRSAQQLLSQRVSLCFYVSVFLCDCVSVSVSVSISVSVCVCVCKPCHFLLQTSACCAIQQKFLCPELDEEINANMCVHNKYAETFSLSSLRSRFCTVGSF